MERKDFYYDLPEEKIALFPLAKREASRLLVYSRETRGIEHARFEDISRWLQPGDALVFNDTRVLAARFVGRRRTGARIEMLLLPADSGPQRAMVQGKGRVKPGEILELEGGKVTCQLVEKSPEPGIWVVAFPGQSSLDEVLRHGRAPLPPYITRARQEEMPPAEDRERYQTVFATRPGAIAAPTAGLHFSPPLLEELGQKGIQTFPVTLHVGLGTFLPVREENLDQHRMGVEEFEVAESTASGIRRTRREGGRIIAIGTTVTRVLETVAGEDGCPVPGRGETDLFLRPPYTFRAIDALITNFHLPESTLLMLVAAFMGREECLRVYREAAAGEYRFYSYGDAMFIQ